MVARLPLPHNSRTTPQNPSPYPHPAPLRLLEGQAGLPGDRLSLQAPSPPPIQGFQWGAKESMRVRGQFQTGSQQQAVRGKLAKKVGRAGSHLCQRQQAGRHVERCGGLCLCAACFWGLIHRALSLRRRGGGRQHDPQPASSPTLGDGCMGRSWVFTGAGESNEC